MAWAAVCADVHCCIPGEQRLENSKRRSCHTKSDADRSVESFLGHDALPTSQVASIDCHGLCIDSFLLSTLQRTLNSDVNGCLSARVDGAAKYRLDDFWRCC